MLRMKGRRILALAAALCLCWGCAFGEGVTTPTDLETPAPTPVPTDAPTEEPSPEPTEEPSPEPTEEPWDEALCDHANEYCEQAPACIVEGCEHVTLDANGLEVPLCALGRWLLDQQDALQRSGQGIVAYSVRSQTIDLNLADATLYRSGSYRVTGGGSREARLTIAPSRLVVLTLDGAACAEISLGNGSQLTMSLTGESTAALLTLGEECEVRVREGGALTIGRVERPAQKAGKILITGGSVKAELDEGGGRAMTAFPAQGAKSVTVEGDPWAQGVHGDGNAYLWLTAPAEGKKWTARLNGTVLEVTQEDDVPEQQGPRIMAGQENVLEGGTTYELAGEIAEGTRLVIDEEGVTLVLQDAVFGGEIAASKPYTLYAHGNTDLSAAVLTGDAEIYARGQVRMGRVNGAATYHGGRIVLPEIPTGYEAFDPGAALTAQSATLDGVEIPLLTSENGALYLPAPAANMTYAITADESAVTVRSIGAKERYFLLTEDAPIADAAGAERFTVEGQGGYVTGAILAGDDAAAEMRNVQLRQEGPVLSLPEGSLTVDVLGDNGLVSHEGDALAVGEGASLTLNVLSGRLLVRHQSSLRGVTLLGNVKVEPEPENPPVCLTIRDVSGNPVPNTPLTVMIDGQRYDMTTHFDGTVYLWGMGDMNGRDIAATDGERVYTAVVTGGSAQATPGLTIEDVQVADAEGAVTVTFRCEGALSAGVQVYVGDMPVDMPDDFASDALRVPAENGAATLAVQPGQTVSLRVYVSASEHAELTKDSADGFQFSELMHFTCRRLWRAEEGAADADYTGKPYVLPLTLPEGAQVSYTGKRLNHDGLPVEVGEYELHVMIPEGNGEYLPGETIVPFEIRRLIVDIIPEANLQKYEGEEDPPFSYTVKGLLHGDEVTGELVREEGEEVGNYAFLTTGLSAPSYYRLRVPQDAPVFTILPNPGGGGFFGVFEKLYPVKQEILRGDGRKVFVTLNTKDTLTVNYLTMGKLMFGTEDNKNRPMSPSLSWNRDADELLLRIQAEAELNDDKGYKTDAAGNPLWTGRYFRISWVNLRHLQRMGVDGISLSNGGAALTVPLADFLSDEMEALVKAHGGDLKSVKYRFDIVPEETDYAAMDGLRPATSGWQVSVQMLVGKNSFDITGSLPGLTLAVDLENLAEVLEDIGLYDEDAFPAQFTLAMKTDAGTEMLPCAPVTPYMPDEMDVAAYPQVMFTHRYFHAALPQSGTVFVVHEE